MSGWWPDRPGIFRGTFCLLPPGTVFHRLTAKHKRQGQALQTEIPRAQRQAGAPPLDQFLAMANRHSAMAQAYRTGCYRLKEIAATFGGHCATVSRAVKAVKAGSRL
jgi:hypothetical protein